LEAPTPPLDDPFLTSASGVPGVAAAAGVGGVLTGDALLGASVVVVDFGTVVVVDFGTVVVDFGTVVVDFGTVVVVDLGAVVVLVVAPFVA
jgi:uncharacterized membrane protein